MLERGTVISSVWGHVTLKVFYQMRRGLMDEEVREVLAQANILFSTLILCRQ